MKVRLLNLVAYHHATGHLHRWHLSTQPGYQSRAGDDPAAVAWLALVKTPPRVSVSVTTWGRTGGDAKVEPGTIGLWNGVAADRNVPRYANVYDLTAGVWLRVPLPSRPLNLLVTDYTVQSVTELVVEQGAPFSSAVPTCRLRVGFPALSGSEIQYPAWDTRRDYDTPFAPEGLTYAGTGGYEGPASLKGTTKERCIGVVPRVTPTYLGVVDGLHRWGVSGGRPIHGVPAGWSSAVPLVLVAGAPTAGQYSVNLSTGIIATSARYEDFRVAVAGETAADGSWPCTIGALVRHVATAAGLATVVDITGIESTPRTVGYYVPAGDGTTIRAVCDALTGSVARGGWYVGIAGTLVVTRLPRPADVVPVRTIRVGIAGRGEATMTPLDADRTVPVKQVIVLCAETPTPGTAAPAASADDVALWETQWREAPSAVNAVVAAAWGRAAQVERLPTRLADLAGGQAEAPLWLEELSGAPQPYTVRVYDGAPGIIIGHGILLVGDMPGYEDGATAVVYGRREEPDGSATLFVVR